jgi:hypothetical protein
MFFRQPSLHFPVEIFCQRKHLVGFKVGNRPGNFIGADISFLSETVQLNDQIRIDACRKGERLNVR